MQKIALVVVLLMCFAAVLPAAAQESAAELPACSAVEMTMLTGTLEGIQSAYEQISEVVSDGAPENLTTAIITYDQLSSVFWEQVIPALPECMESRELSYTVGLILDESLIASALARLAIYEQEYGDEEIAVALAEHGIARAETLQSSVDSYFTAIEEVGVQPREPLPACTEADWNLDSVAAFQESALSFQDLGQRSQEATGIEGFAPLTVEYAAISSTFWNEIYATLPACAEIEELAFKTGLVLDNSLILILLTQMAQYEAEYGTAAIAQIYSDSATARAEDLIASGTEFLETLNGES